MKNINWKAVIGVASAVIAGLVAFTGEISNQKKEARINSMDSRLTFLENKFGDQ